MAIFRVLFAAACLLKFVSESWRGAFRYADEGAFLAALWSARHRHAVSPTLYRAGYALKIAAAVLLLVGGPPAPVAASVLAAWFWFEGKFYFKFHVNLFLLMAAGLAATPTVGLALSVWPFAATGVPVPEPQAPALGQWLIVAGVSTLYVAGGVHKLTSTDARAGATMYQSLKLIVRDRQLRPGLDGYYPARLIKVLVTASDTDLERRWRPLIAIAIIIQVALPFLLLNEQTWMLGLFAGGLMQAAITATMPMTLAHFSAAIVGSYLLFLPPGAVGS